MSIFDADIPSFDILEVARTRIVPLLEGKIKTLTGQSINVSLNQNDTISDIKRKVSEKGNFPAK
jgi:hypothetical protein